jgi:nicotinamidase-related amidase
MHTLDADNCTLLLIDLQARLMPAINAGTEVLENARRLRDAAKLLGVSTVFTEQNPAGIGATTPEMLDGKATVETKMTFDACRVPGFHERLPEGAAVIAGCEAHVCVLQTALGLLERKRQVYLVADAVGSRLPVSKETALRRLERHGAEIVTTEMVLFEWLGSCEHPRFRDVLKLVKST